MPEHRKLPEDILTTLCCLFIIILSLGIRYFFSNTIENGGDAYTKWAIIRCYTEFGLLPTIDEFRSHHMLRWAINIPVFLIQKIFGTAPNVYYFWPFAISTLGAVFCFFIGRYQYSRRWGLLFGAAFIISRPFLLRQGCQYLPMGAATVYFLGSILWLQLWIDSKKIRYIYLGGIFLFFSYGAKITALYYLPGYVIIIALFSKNRHNQFSMTPLLTLIVLLGVLLFLEAMVTQALTQVPGGRIAALLSDGSHISHIGKRLNKFNMTDWKIQSNSLIQYLANVFVYLEYAPGRRTKLLYYLALGIAAMVLIKKQKKLYALGILYLFGFFGHAYSVIHIFPFTRPERVLARYQTLLFILAMLLTLSHFVLMLNNSGRFQTIFQGVKQTPTGIRSLFRQISLKQLIILYGCFVFCLIPPNKYYANGYAITKSVTQQISQARSQHNPILIWSDFKGYSNYLAKWKYCKKYHAIYGDPRNGKYNPAYFRSLDTFLFFQYYIRQKQYILIEGPQPITGKKYLLLDNY